MGWQDDPIVAPAAPTTAKAPWESDPVAYPAEPSLTGRISRAWTAGYQGSVAGLVDRGRLPDVVLDPQHSKWYERAVSGLSQIVNEGPESIAGAVVGGMAGGTAGPLGALLGAGGGSFAVPAAIRESLIQAYTKGEVTGIGDFFDRAAIVLKQAGKEGVIGMFTAGAGKAAQVGSVAAGLGAKGTVAAVTGAELGALTVTPAALEGRMPEPQDFLDAAVLLVGLKGATHGATKLMEVYKATGKTPLEVAADAKADPTIAEDIAKGGPTEAEPGLFSEGVTKAPVEQAAADAAIPRAYKEMARDMNAREAVPEPSAEARAFMEKPFADIPQGKGEPILDTHVNYNYLNTADDVKGALARLSELNEAKIRDATRGTVSNEQTYAEARALYEQTTGEKAPEAAIGNADYAKLAADIYARKQLLVGGAEQLMTMRQALMEATAAGIATPQMRLEFLAQVDRVAQAQAAVRGSQAEVGRALQILKSTNRDKAYYEQLNEVLNGRFGVERDAAGGGFTGKVFGDVNFNTMLDMLGDFSDPKQALQFAEKASKATTWQKVVEAWKAGLVSGPFTQIANILGNVTFEATRPLVDVVAVAVNRASGSPERMSAVEPLARIIGNVHGTVDGARMAWSTLLTGNDMTKVDQHRKAIEGTAGEIIRTPFRLLSATDAFFRISNERGEAYTLAARQAAAEGYNPATREFRARLQEIAQNPTDAMQAQIEAAGQRFTFNTPLGEAGQSIQSTIRQLHLEWAVPFVQTPANVAKEMLRLTPAAPIIGEWRAAIAEGGVARNKAIAEMVVGTAVGTAMFSFASSGSISGSGDPDPRKRAVQMAAGWQPYSVKIGDTWYSYQRLQPVGTLIGMAADMADAWEHLTPDESDKIPKILSTAFANAITNQTFLQGITNIINAISDPNRFGPRFVQGLAGSLVPGIVAQPAQMMDPYKREVDSVMDAVKNRLPGMSETLRPKRDAYGEPIPANDRFGEISPITMMKASNDKVRMEAARLGIGVSKAPDHIQLPSGKDPKLGRVDLTSEQRDIFADKAGHMAYHVLSQLVNSPTWDNLPDLAQRNAMDMVFEKTKAFGRAAAVPPEQMQREATRIADELRTRLQPK